MAVPVLAVAAAVAGVVFGFSPVRRGIDYASNYIVPNQELDVSGLVELYFRGLISEDDLRKRLRKYGYKASRVEEIINISKKLLSAEGLTVAKWRKVFSEDDKANEEAWLREMKRLGFDEGRAKIFEQVRLFYPSPSDFITFAVREVFNPKVVKEFGYDEDFPEDIVPYAEKSGMKPEVLRWYWRAHWNLPSTTMGYEMLHRLNPDVLSVIGDKYKDMGLDPDKLATDLNTVDTLLKVADVPKYWRRRLLAVSYYPLTRVDLRRIYELGLIGEEELLARLMELGYSKKDAALMVEFYKKYKMDNERDLTQSQIQKAYEFGLIDDQRVIESLQLMGYDEDEAGLILELWKIDYSTKELEDRINTIKEMYKAGLISYEDAITQLDHMNLTSSYREKVLAQMVRARQTQTQLPTKADLAAWLKMEIIDEDTYRQRMKELGYRDEDIEYYVQQIKMGVAS